MKIIILYVFLITVSIPGFNQSFSIGLIADCQYCKCDFSEKWNNDYQQGLPRLIEAVDTFNNQKVDLAFHLGDFIDRDFSNFKVVSNEYNKLKMPHYHVLGNHDYSVLDSLKNRVQSELNLEKPYYSVTTNGWQLIVLDGTDISLYKSADSVYLKEAEQVRLAYLKTGRSQAQTWNGAISGKQLVWLDTQLKGADQSKANVIIFCHFPILPKGDANLWNDVELVQLIEKHTSVKAFINGHHHAGNYIKYNGVHYLTLHGMVRTKEQNSFAIITLFDTKINIQGFGREPNRTFKF